jgi:hypothetical protein
LKKLKFIFCIISLILIFSCNKDDGSNDILSDDPSYYDQDECEQSRGTCCDTDGRIFVVPNQIYTYTYFNNTANATDPKYTINWEVLEGSIVLLSGQNTSEAKFKFNTNFTKGKIRATGKVADSCCECQSTIEISKL